METKRLQRGVWMEVMAIVAMILICTFATVSSDADPSDVREVSLYAGDPFIYAPEGDWSEASASGSGILAGLRWSEGTLMGTIQVPGEYLVTIQDDERELSVAIEVLQVTTIGGDHGHTSADVVLVVGSEAGIVITDTFIDGADGTVVGIVNASGLFEFIPNTCSLTLARDVTSSDVGSMTVIVNVKHEVEGTPLYDTSRKDVNVTIVPESYSGRDVTTLASLGNGDCPTVTVIDGTTIKTVSNPIYASGPEPVIDWFGMRSIEGGIAIYADVIDSDGVRINWGDGTRTNVSVDSVDNIYQHQYSDSGEYIVIMTAYGSESEARAVAYHDYYVEETEYLFIFPAYLLIFALIPCWMYVIGAVVSAGLTFYTGRPEFIAASFFCSIFAVLTYLAGVTV